MLLVTQITNAARQAMTVALEDGSQVEIHIYFVPMQYGWFITSLTYGDFELTSLRITNNPNMLLPFKNKIPFGLACFSTDDREPTQIEDFSSGASKLYLLSAEEVEEYSEILSSG